MRFEGKEGWTTTLAIAVPMWIACYGLFRVLLVVPWPQTILGDLFPSIRFNAWLDLF
jgi:putative tricarboxylic transport membrane protein